MSTPVLATKLYIPPLRPNAVLRPRLIERLNEGLYRKMTLISAPAGSGKTTLVSEWVTASPRPTAWLSLDEADNDPARFLIYVIAALQTIAPGTGEQALRILHASQSPPNELILTSLLNDMTDLTESCVLVLDDYHLIQNRSVDEIIAFLLTHLPLHMHLVLATRENPRFSFARLRARNQMTELRVNDLRFTPDEAAKFLNQAMGLTLSTVDIATLEARTEGWIAGLQLAAMSLQGHADATRFIQSFAGSHHFVADYLIEEVFQQQSESVQTFLLYSSILDRLCGPLCDAVLLDQAGSAQAMLEYLERVNLFIVPLDNDRHWYRYHHLFAELLQQRLHKRGENLTHYHQRASLWYEAHGFQMQAFHHATAAHDSERAEHLIEGNGMPLLFQGTMTPILNWLESLPESVLNARPSLWVWSAFASMSVGQPSGIEEKLLAAEAALKDADLDDRGRDLIGRIAAIRTMLAIPYNNIETMLTQSRRALAYLHPDNLPIRTATTWALGYAHHVQGDRTAASLAYTEAISISQASGNTMFGIAALSSLASIQETDNLLHLAAETYQRVLEMAGDPPLPHANGAYLGLAQIYYEWNDLEAAQHYAQQALHLARQIKSIDTPALCGALLARLRLTQGDAKGASAILAEADRFVLRHQFVLRLPDLAAVRVLILLYKGDLEAAAHLAQTHNIPLSQARVYLAQGNPSAVLALLESWQQTVQAKGQVDDQLKGMVLQAVAFYLRGEKDQALQQLADALKMAEHGGFIRLFVDEGPPMARLLQDALARGIAPSDTRRLLAAFSPTESQKSVSRPSKNPLRTPALVEPLSDREIEVLHHIAQGLTNQEIADHLSLSLNTVKVHSRNIYGKLDAHNRMQAVAAARALGLLPPI